MSPQTSKAAAELFAGYEASLTALLAVPDQVTKGLADAKRDSDEAHKAADDIFQRQSARLASLLKNAQARYDGAVCSLKEHSVILPSQVRAESEVEGDEQALKRAVNDHVAAVTAVDAQVREAKAAAERAEDNAKHRAGAARKANEALQARQQKLRLEREAAAEAARRTEHQAAVRKRRLILGMCSGGFVLALVIVLTVFSLNT
ncbi:hypothetical protein [Arthrobacter sp. B1I2]|uniref:hypothetical protein n=1 Tax=Arthrobacter sp. B1I2 TaxID=3042263 RepID=UPI00278B7EDB|nr:hypothetical protein [Arthrobacter sp. B1I2]MDQ0733465.1 phage-related minor tail protein [Arthrobacter sp. B1I2]